MTAAIELRPAKPLHIPFTRFSYLGPWHNDPGSTALKGRQRGLEHPYDLFVRDDRVMRRKARMLLRKRRGWR